MIPEIESLVEDGLSRFQKRIGRLVLWGGGGGGGENI